MDSKEYKFRNAEHSLSHTYLLPMVDKLLLDLKLPEGNKRVFDLGCGNGSVANHFVTSGYEVTGIDPSLQGIQEGKKRWPDMKIYEGSAYDDLSSKYGQFPALISLEVVEHVYQPRVYAKNLYNLIEQGGTAIISTPYHGYAKNIALAVANKMDFHFTALLDNGHIKFWSMNTLSSLLKEVGFREVRFERVGRIPI